MLEPLLVRLPYMKSCQIVLLLFGLLTIVGCRPPVIGTYTYGSDSLSFKNDQFQFSTSTFLYKGSYEIKDNTVILTPEAKLGAILAGEKGEPILLVSRDKWKSLEMTKPFVEKLEKQNDWYGDWVDDERWAKEGRSFPKPKK